MKSIILAGLLCSFLFMCSGCATILGGIIGHQSGEMGAGIAIGAAVDFGDDIYLGMAKALADVDKEFQKNSRFNAASGSIQLPFIAFTPERMQKVITELENKFKENNWSYELSEKSAKTGLFCKSQFEEKWNCKTSQQQEFHLQMHYKEDEDPILTVSVPADSQANIAEVTSTIYQWLKEIAGKI